MVGLALGYIVVKTESLWIAIAVHAANNFISVAFTYLLAGLSQNAQNLVYSLYLMVALIAGVSQRQRFWEKTALNSKKAKPKAA